MIASCFEYILLLVAFSPIISQSYFIQYNQYTHVTANVEYTLVVNKTTKKQRYVERRSVTLMTFLL